jgi:hypothetical protein
LFGGDSGNDRLPRHHAQHFRKPQRASDNVEGIARRAATSERGTASVVDHERVTSIGSYPAVGGNDRCENVPHDLIGRVKWTWHVVALRVPVEQCGEVLPVRDA